MREDLQVPLLHFKNIVEWKPQVGDIVIKHGFFQRTKWFGIVQIVGDTGQLSIIRNGMIKLLALATDEEKQKNAIEIHTMDISQSRGGYTVAQHGPTGPPIWYV